MIVSHILSVDLTRGDFHRMYVSRDSDSISFGFVFKVFPQDGVVDGVQVGRESVISLVVVPNDQIRFSFDQTRVSVDRGRYRPASKSRIKINFRLSILLMCLQSGSHNLRGLSPRWTWEFTESSDILGRFVLVGGREKKIGEPLV
jgi:hypothetical protein